MASSFSFVVLNKARNPSATPQEGELDLSFIDQADYIFHYALYPQQGDARTGDVVQSSYEFNQSRAVQDTAAVQNTAKIMLPMVSGET